jgi:uncharacterized protein (DUF3084 family)
MSDKTDDQIEELIREIATRHGIVVARDDPILVLQTINNRLLQNSAKAQQEQLDKYKQEMEALALRWGDDAKGKAERILNASMTAAKQAMGQLLEEGARTTAQAISDELDSHFAKVARPVQDTRRIALLNIVASCISLVGAGIVLWCVPH